MNEQLAELGQYLGHFLGGAAAFSLLRFTGVERVIAMIFGICLAIGVWFLAPAILLNNWPSADDDWFEAALFVHSIMAVTLAGMGAFLFKRR